MRDYYFKILLTGAIEGGRVSLTCGHAHLTREGAARCWRELSPMAEIAEVGAARGGRLIELPDVDRAYFKSAGLSKMPREYVTGEKKFLTDEVLTAALKERARRSNRIRDGARVCLAPISVR